MTMKRYKLVHAQKDLLEYRIIFINTYKNAVKDCPDFLRHFQSDSRHKTYTTVNRYIVQDFVPVIQPIRDLAS